MGKMVPEKMVRSNDTQPTRTDEELPSIPHKTRKSYKLQIQLKKTHQIMHQDNSKNVKRIILYTCFTIGEWKSITKEVLSQARADTILVHFTLPNIISRRPMRFLRVLIAPLYPIWFRNNFKRQFGQIHFSFSINKRLEGESTGIRKQLQWIQRNRQRFNSFTHLTYCHSKGVCKNDNESVRKWRDLTKYYLFERPDLEAAARANHYTCYGSLLRTPSLSLDMRKGKALSPLRKRLADGFMGCHWHYQGTFYTIFLTDQHETISNLSIETGNRWAMEALLGRFFPIEAAFNCATYTGSLYHDFSVGEREKNDFSSHPCISET
jgi:hypothetical protein